MLPAVANRRARRLSSFTLVELLVVILIIVILMGIILAASQGVLTSSARSRTRAEIQALSTSLEAYKTDNATYPQTNTFSSPTAYPTVDPTSQNYYQSSQLLYESLSGMTNYLDTPVTGIKYYMVFKLSQLGNAKTAGGTPLGASSTYVQDPFGYSYGYSTGTNTPASAAPLNGLGFFDLWSTGGATYTQMQANNLLTNAWINNWSQ